MFEASRDWVGYVGIANPPTFYTVRWLANSLAEKAQESKEAIQKNNAHKLVDTQLICQEGYDLPFDDTPIQFTAD